MKEYAKKMVGGMWLVAALLLMAVGAMAQGTQKMVYQAVARDASGQVVVSSNVGVRITLLKDQAEGTTVWSKRAVLRTDAGGLISYVLTDLQDVDWGSGSYYLRIEIDPEGGSDYVVTTVQQVVSVPYALHAEVADSLDLRHLNISESDPLFLAWDRDYNSLINRPTAVSAFVNDAGYLTAYTEGQNLADVVAVGNAAGSQLKNVSDPTEALDVVNLQTLTASMEALAARMESIIDRQGRIIDSLHLEATKLDPNTRWGVDVKSACDSYTWINGRTYTESDSAAVCFLTSSIGHDSVVTLHLTLLHGSTGDTSAATTASSYTWHGHTYTASGDYRDTLTSAAGCDSVVTLHLTFVAPVTITGGALPGEFSVADGQKVHFSRGNLQYNAAQGTHATADGGTAQGTWRFAEKQYDTIFHSNFGVSSTYNGWIDLFGWGTSGWNSGAVAYQPWSTSTNNADYYPGGDYTNSLTGNYANADWGVYNAISNGGNTPGSWRTLTRSEWIYLLTTRAASTVNGTANARYAKATVAGEWGVVVFPDVYSHPAGLPSPTNINVSNGAFTLNNYNADQWSVMETAGCVFLSLAGYRYGTGIIDVTSSGRSGNYWSSTYRNNIDACNLDIYETTVNPADDEDDERCFGMSVRLVQDVPQQ